ncbi:MAG: anthranilate synthase component I [Lentisphaeria bacterium]
MFKPALETFRQLAKPGTLVPVFREHLADLETPVSAFARFAGDPCAFLLESVEGGEQWGRYSFIGVNPRALVTVADGRAVLETPGRPPEELPFTDGVPLFALRPLLDQVQPVALPGLPRFIGGAVGYLAYEAVRQFEPRLKPPVQPLPTPEARFMIVDQIAIFDNVRHTVKVVACVRPDEFADADAAYAEACRRIAAVEAKLKAPPPATACPAGAPAQVDARSNVTQAEFEEMVRRGKAYIEAGDIIQVVLSQRFTTPLPAAPLDLYRALRLVNPSPYTFFLKFGDHHLIGSSPEVLVRLTGRKAETRPIAGTRPRGATEQEDRELADDLLRDEKERAEHVMLVDLGRNDLGRVAAPGSVQVRDFMSVERYSHVMHIVSHVQAELQPGRDALDLIRAAFPAGTLSGAPKVRAMEIIRELEPAPRGVYGGAVGYFGYDGNMDMAITIRTIELRDGQAAVQAGAGIVADSDPEREYQETVSKARGMVRAMELAARGLEL